MAQPHIQVILADESIPDSLHSALQRTAATAAFWPLSEALRPGRTPAADVVVVVVPDDPTQVAGPLRRLFDRLATTKFAERVYMFTDENIREIYDAAGPEIAQKIRAHDAARRA